MKKTCKHSSAFKLVICTIFVLCIGIISKAQNPIVTENALPGNPSTEWDISGAGDLTIQGFADGLSVNKGNTIDFKINVDDGANFNIKIYRLGYYQGNGARLITDLGNFSGIIQPAPITDVANGLVDCGNWSVAASWAVPATAVSGVYIARLTRLIGGGASHIIFIVRDDASTADLLFQTSDGTWQAYNAYGGNSLYVGNTSYPGGHATKVSYNRPFITRSGGGGSASSEDWIFNAEYPMIRWLERNGYNLSYATSIDVTRNANLLQNHKVYMSVGHDEYWSKEQRNNIEAARNNGKHLAFFCGNEVYWKTRWENSIDGTNTPYRTLVCYKEGTMGENVCGSKCDPSAEWTGLWRDGCAPDYPANDGCLPENALSGQISWVGAGDAIQVPATFKNLRFWRNTSIASLSVGQTATLSENTLGYEIDWEQDNGKYPSGRITLSSTNIGGKTHKVSLYKHSSGAWVFGAGTVQWSWGLDSHHDRGVSVEDINIQQATVNLFADMDVQPGSLQIGLVPATASTDNIAPVSVINSPVNTNTVFNGLPVTITGTSSDGNTVAGVEVSLDGGLNWQPAAGTTNWSYTWTPNATGTFTIKCRSFDDSGNMEIAGNAPSSNAITINVINLSAPENGPGGPVLVISNLAKPFSRYPVEILRAEAINEFEALDITAVTNAILDNYDVVVLGEMNLSAPTVTMLTDWVHQGGTLITLRPDSQLSSLLGITPTGGTISDKYILVNTVTGPGVGIVNQTIQFHGTADLYNLNGATSLATFYSDANTSTIYPAITSNAVGANGGSAVAFFYDLAKSVVYTRQGNPAWAGDERDGTAPIRPNDLFFGNKVGDPQSDWVDFDKIAIPQADEQMHLLTNIIIQNNLHKKPLPRFWFLPRRLKAAVVMTGDDHANNGTTPRFNQYLSLSPSNTATAVADWTAIRGTSYIYPNTSMSSAEASTFEGQGFEIALHVNTGCNDWTPTSLQNDIASQSADLFSAFPGISPLTTSRTHCIAWSDWASQPEIEAANGIRLDVNYYYWPGSWVQNRPGMFTGSGMPMRFAKLDGSLIDCYQVVTQMTDESNITYTTFCNALLDKAIGPEGYYGVFCANMHTDNAISEGSDAIIASALARQIPVISAKQMLNWLDGRNNSSFSSITWDGSQLGFTITDNTGLQQLNAMLPLLSSSGSLISIKKENVPVDFTVETIKGIAYAFFDASSGNYTADYVVCTPPTATIVSNTPICVGEPINLVLQSATGQPPFDLQVNGMTYDDVSVGQTFATINTNEISIYANTGSPDLPAAQDQPSIEVGVKFRSSAYGYITGIRFYKGAANTGTHIGTLWSNAGVALATATFTNESTSGWQEVRFASPVAIQPNTTYIASYFSPNGYYAYTGNYFNNGNASNGPLTLLSSGVDGSNGVFNFPGAGFPTLSYNSANYWVDILFSEILPATTSLNYTLTNISDNNYCSNSGANLSTATVTMNPLPNGILSSNSFACGGKPINLVFTSTTGTGPFSLVINGNTYNNITSGVEFNSNIIAPATTPISIWNNSTTGGEPTVSDNDAVELGVKFRSTIAGTVSGVRFYKRTQQPNGATYTGRLWKIDGTLLGTCTFTSITNSGWQQANFASPISIDANTTYIVSYHTPNGEYAYTPGAFSSSGVTNGPLTALQSGVDGPNGVFKYGAGGVFPDQSFNDANYWVDIVLNGVGITNFDFTGITDANGCTSNGALQTLSVLSTNCAPLPVTLIKLSAEKENKNIKLTWSTLTEINNKGFEVFRSTDAIHWIKIGFVNGAGTSNAKIDYSYVDKNPAPGHYYYRLNQIDYDGQSKLSNIVSVKLNGDDFYVLKQNFPNPFSNETTIEYTLPKTQPVKIILTDLQGRLIKVLVNAIMDGGNHIIVFNKNQLASGIYLYKMEAGNFKATRKLLIQ
ncbi:MAG: DUF4082 domain-containing protein [Chitinophagaceae bacterium]|nr:DUF4082 domain-containing protein [Chitinophagaceae bacterium]